MLLMPAGQHWRAPALSRTFELGGRSASGGSTVTGLYGGGIAYIDGMCIALSAGKRSDSLRVPTCLLAQGRSLFVADEGLGAVVKLDSNLSVQAMTRPSILCSPAGLAVMDGLLYCSDRQQHRVVAFDVQVRGSAE